MKTYYKGLVVWQKSMDLVVQIYSLTKLLPKTETYGLANQMQRSSVSIPSNIAEGQQRKSNKEFLQFLSIAKGSYAELETQLELCLRLEFLSQSQLTDCQSLLSEVGKMLNTLIQKLATSN